ncbi:APC membrane recruitment protein 2 [Mugil cephalus]|uniref:APC membrane recruitment protein 2 n=1 Tax=Mugil cephalus TaxID=48193 RepID=UPI001FB82725|nr:APC membrane recruitment protein 2 [Mugil cephalus]
MDVQTENMDPPPGESQSSGKIRKGFKLFGKRKTGNIFSIRSKGSGNNKSPVIRSKTLEELSGTPDSAQEWDMEKGHEVSQGETEQAEEEPVGEDGVLAAAHARASISSASSAKSLTFLSLLRGGRRGVGDRRVHTVSQPMSRQRRGLKGLFSNVKFLSKDKEDKGEAPPSPLLMSSRANSVEIIKEDLTLTPKSHPRSLESPETESCEPDRSSTTQDSTATTPMETTSPKVTTGSVSRTNEHVPPLPTSEPPLIPGESSLSSLLADISSLLTFDSISGGGDIMADVEAEWGKASSAISAVVTQVTASSTSLFSKPTISSPLTSTAVCTAETSKPSPVATSTTTLPQSLNPLTKTTSTSCSISKPSTIITTLTKSSTLTTHSVRMTSDSSPAPEPFISIKIKSTPDPTGMKPSMTPVTLTSFSAPIMSPPLTTIKSTVTPSFTTTTAPPNTPATIVKAPSVSPNLTSTASKLASEISALPQTISAESKPGAVASSPPPSVKTPSVTHSPPIPVAITQPSPAKFDSATSLNGQTSISCKSFLSSATGEPKVPVTVSPPCTVTKLSPAPVIPSTSTTTSGLISAVVSQAVLTTAPMDLNRAPPSLVTVPDICLPASLTGTTKTQPTPASVPSPSLTSLDMFPPTPKPTAPLSSDKIPPTPRPSPVPVVSMASPTLTAVGQTLVSQSKAPPAQTLISVSTNLPAPVQMQISQSKVPTIADETPDLVSKAPDAPYQMPVSVSKAPLAPAHIPVPVSKTPPAFAHIPVSVSKPSAPAHIPVSASTDPPASDHIPTYVSKDVPAPKTGPCPVTSHSSVPAPCLSDTPATAKMKGSGLTTVDWQQANPNNTSGQAVQAEPSKTELPESQTSLQGHSREKRTPQVKASGLSKIPVVGGSRVGKLPVRDSQHTDDEVISRDPPTPVEERAHFNSHDVGSKDKICAVEANAPTSKHTQEESQQLQQPRVLSSLPRDSKIPVKHGAQSHPASQIPQIKEPPRTKIPVSKVPVRRVGKPPATGGSIHIRK